MQTACEKRFLQPVLGLVPALLLAFATHGLADVWVAPDSLQFDRGAEVLNLGFESRTNVSYRAEMSTNLAAGWVPASGVVPGREATAWVALTPTSAASLVYFRVAIESAVSFAAPAGPWTNGVTVALPMDYVGGTLATNQAVVVELVDSNGAVYAQTPVLVPAGSHPTNALVSLVLLQDLPWGDHGWTLRAYVSDAATGAWSAAAARWSTPVEVRVFPSFLSTSGRHIVDATGRRTALRGVNLGAWLVYEDWILEFEPAWVNEFAVREWLQHISLGGQAYPVFEAERYDAMQGLTNYGDYVGYFDAGDWFCVSNLTFDPGVRGLYLTVAVDPAFAGRQIEVRRDHAGGELLGTLTVRNTGGWFNWSRQYVPFSSPLSGTGALCFVGQGGDGVANVNWFQLDLAHREAEQCEASQGVTLTGGHVGSFDDGDWIAFSNVNFGVGTRGLVAELAVAPASAGQQIEVRLGGPAGPLVGRHTVRATTGWGDYDGQFLNFTQRVSGVHDLYLVARGTLGGVADVDWIKVVSEGLLEDFRDAYFTTHDFDDLQALGYNVVRLPFAATLLEEDEAPFHYKQAGWDLLDRFVEQCRLRGLYVLLGLHAAAGGHNPFEHNGQKDHDARLWQDFDSEPADPCGTTVDNGPCNRERTEQLWRAIAERYRAHPAVLGYGLLNEPIADYATRIAPFNARLYDAIRAQGDNHLVLMMNPNFGQVTVTPEQPNDLFALTPDVQGNGWFGVVYEYHPYRYILDPYVDTSFEVQKATADTLVRQYDYLSHFRQVPVFLGEFMPGSRRNFDYFTRQFNAHDVHWTHWTFKIPSYQSDWGLSYRSGAWDQIPDLDADDAATLQAKFTSYSHTNYTRHELLRSILGRNAADTNRATYRADFYSSRFSAPDGDATTTWPFDGLEVRGETLNGGFEVDGLGAPGGSQLVGWQTFGTAQRVNFQPRGGTYHAQVYGLGAAGTNVNFAGVEQKQAARAGQVWRGAVHALLPADHPANDNKIRLQLEFYADLAAQPGDLLDTAFTEVEAWWWPLNAYQPLQVSATAPAGTKAVKLVAVYESHPYQDGSVYFDDAQLEWQPGVSTADLLNSGFESGSGGSFDTWSFSGNGQRDSFSARSGSYHAHLWGPGVGGTATSTARLDQVVQAYTRQGDPWRMEVFVRPWDNPDSTNRIRLSMRFFADAVAAPTNLLATYSFTWDSAWMESYQYNPLRIEGVAPTSGAVAIQVAVEFLNEPGTAGSVLLDDVALADRSTDRPNALVVSNAVRVALNGGPLQMRFRSRRDTDARFEVNDAAGTWLSAALSNVLVEAGGAFALNLAATRDAVTRTLYDYNTQGVIARLLYRDDHPGTQVTVQVYAKNWDLATLGTLLHTSAPVAFEPGARLQLYVNQSTAEVRYGSAMEWSGNHGMDLSSWVNGAVGVVEVQDLVAGGSDEYVLLDDLKAERNGADTSRVFEDDFDAYPQNATFAENTQYWIQSDDQSFIHAGQWLWKPEPYAGAVSWMNPRWAYHEPVRLRAASNRVADVRVTYRNFSDWDAITKIGLLPESFTGALYGEYAGRALYLEVSRVPSGPGQGRMWFRLFRHDGVDGLRTLLAEHDTASYVDGRVISLQVSADQAVLYYGSDLLLNVAHGLDTATVFPDGLFPHLEFQRAAQDFLFLDDVECRERPAFAAP